LRPGRNSVVIVKIGTVSCRRSFRTGIQVCSCEAEDGTGTLSVIWFNRKGLGSILTEGTSVALFGLPSFCEGRIEFSNPEFEIVKDASGIAGFTGIVPVYPLTAGLPERWLRKLSPACERISSSEHNRKKRASGHKGSPARDAQARVRIALEILPRQAGV